MVKRTARENFWWAIHNLIAHPVAEILFWVGLEKLGNQFHDWTVPKHGKGSGRG